MNTIVMMRRDVKGEGEPHRHGFDVDLNSNGRTTTTLDGQAPHEHRIRARRVLSAGGSPHTHEFLPDGETVNTRKRAY